MKKLQRALSVFVMMLTACLTLPSRAQAAETTKSIGDNLSLLYCIRSPESYYVSRSVHL